MTICHAVDELNQAAVGGGVLGAFDFQSHFQVLADLIPSFQAHHAVRYSPCLPPRKWLHGTKSCGMEFIRLTQRLLGFLIPFSRFLRLTIHMQAITYAHCHLADIRQDFGKHDPVARFGFSVNFTCFLAKLVANFYLVSLLLFLAKPSMRFAQVPDVEPRGWLVVNALHLRTFSRVLQTFLSFIERRVTPCKVSVHDVVKLPAFFGPERHQPLNFLQGDQCIPSSELLHPHCAELIQCLDVPGASLLLCQRHYSFQHHVALVNVIILEVDPNQIQSNTYVSWFAEGGCEFCSSELLRQGPCL
mmetsp:Transcript_103199/g.183374  ORF Transcript_103199/g.183374 Transcript_103199/m.183374 type:complete len:302 (-) Transcript_103199:40-945(-)